MSVRYLLPCTCGETVLVGASQAGDMVVCGACGASLEAPRLRELRELPTEETGDPASNGWSFRLGLVSCFLILAGLLAAGGAWFAITEPPAPKPFDMTARMEFVDKSVEGMTPLQLWESYINYYKPMAEAGMYEAQSPQDTYTLLLIEKSQRYRNLLLMSAGGLVLLSAVLYAILPKSA